MIKHGHRPCLQNLGVKIIEDGEGRACIMKNYEGLLRFARNDRGEFDQLRSSETMPNNKEAVD